MKRNDSYKKIRFFIGRSLEIFLALALLFVAAIYLRLMLAPVSLDFIVPSLQQTLQRDQAIDSLAIGSVALDFGSRYQVPAVAIRDYYLTGQADTWHFSGKRIDLLLNLFALMRGELKPVALQMQQPHLRLRELANDSSDISMDLPAMSIDQQIRAAIAQTTALIRKADTLLPVFRSFRIDDADIAIIRETDSINFSIPQLVLRKGEGLGPDNLLLYVRDILRDEAVWLEFDVSFVDVPLPQLIGRDIGPQFVDSSHFNLSGEISLQLNKRAQLVGLQMRSRADSGLIYIDSLLTTLPPLDNFSLRFSIGPRFTEMRIDDCRLQIAGSQWQGSASLQQENGLQPWQGRINVDYLPVHILPRFWPPRLLSATRQWLSENLHGGALLQIEARFEDREGLFNWQVKSRFDTLQLTYLSSLPPLKEGRGNVIASNGGLQASLSRGQLLGSQLSDVKAGINDFSDTTTVLTLSGSSRGPAADLLAIAGHMGMDTLMQIQSGEAVSHIDLQLRLDTIPAFPDFPLAFQSQAEGIKISQFGGYDFAVPIASVELNRDTLRLRGTAVRDSIKANLDYRQLLSQSDSLELLADINLRFADLAVFDIPPLTFANGPIASQLALRRRGERYQLTLKSDFRAAAINMPRLGWSKPANAPATFALGLLYRENAPLRIENWRYEEAETRFQGRLYFTEQSTLRQFRLHIDSLQLGPSNLALYFAAHESSSDTLKLWGRKFDVRPFLQTEKQALSDTSSAGSSQQDLYTEFDLDTLLMNNYVVYREVQGNFNIAGSTLAQADLAAQYGREEEVILRYNNPDQGEKFLFSAADAGIILAGTGIDTTVSGGRLTIRAYPDSLRRGYRGSYTFADIRLRRSPLFAQLFALTSIDGIRNSLNNEGIVFTLMEGDFHVNKKRLQLSDGRIYSNAIGITYAGRYQWQKQLISIEGTLIPINFLNGILAEIPLVRLLVDHGGIFAMNYSIRGKADDLDVSGNPLSIITPGFTRNIFRIFEQVPDSLRSKVED
jgi:hypothetical protein